MANLLLVSCQNGPQGEADVISRSAHLRSLFSQIYAARFALPAGSAGKTTFWSLFSGRAKQLARCFFLSKWFTSSLTFTFVLTAATFRLVRDRQESIRRLLVSGWMNLGELSALVGLFCAGAQVESSRHAHRKLGFGRARSS